MSIRAVVFDIGGVLELTPRTGWEHRWASELDLPLDEFERRIDSLWAPGQIGGSPLAVIERRTAEALSLDAAQLDRLMDDIWAEYLGTLNEELAIFFAGLRPRYRTGILSNSLVGARERERAAYGLEDLCDVLVYSHEEGMAKPDPRFYRLVCDRLEVGPEEAVFLDDTPECVEGARTVGMHAVQFIANDRALEELARIMEGHPIHGRNQAENR
jgi:epoxide hydrolase-like predicted phosphatase